MPFSILHCYHLLRLFISITTTQWLFGSPVLAFDYKIGLALPLSSPEHNLISAIKDVVELGMVDVNLWASKELPGNTFSLLIYDTFDIDTKAVDAVFDAAKLGAVGMIGEFSSDPSIAMALAAGQFRMWQCSGSATLDRLSEQSDFAYFFRTIPPNKDQAVALGLFLLHMKWHSCAILSVNNVYGQDLTRRFVDAVNDFQWNISIKTIQTFSRNTSFPVRGLGYGGALRAILNSGTRIVLFFGTDTDFIPIARRGKKMGMFASKEWVWVGSDGISTLIQEETRDRLPESELELLNGLFYPSIIQNGKHFLDFKRRYIEKTGKTATPYYGTMTLDCAFAIAHGIKRLLTQYDERSVIQRETNATMNDFIANFTSPNTGDVLIQPHGDPISSFYIHNIEYGESIRTHIVQLPARLVIERTNFPPIFGDGTRNVPRHRPLQIRKYPIYGDVGVWVVLFLTGSVLVIIFGTMVYLYIHRHHPNVRHMSLPMLSMISAGLCLVLVSTILWIGVPTKLSCNVSKWVFFIGFELAMSATAAKAYRIWKVFDNCSLRKLTKLGDGYLFIGCSVIIIVQVILLLIWICVAPLYPTQCTTFTSVNWVCSAENKNSDQIMFSLSVAYNGLLILVVSYLAYKTRKAYSAFRESIFIMYALQNMFLSGLIVAPFLFAVVTDFALGAYYIRTITIIYACTFTFGCLVGRIALGLHQAIAKCTTSSTTSSIRLRVTGIYSNPDSTSDADGALMPHRYLPPPSSSSNLLASNKVHALQGKYPVKVANRLFVSWQTQRLTLLGLEGYLGMTRFIQRNKDQGTERIERGRLFKLRSIQFDPSPSAYPMCIEIRADLTSYLVQFRNDMEKSKWVRALSVHCLAMSRSSSSTRSVNEVLANGLNFQALSRIGTPVITSSLPLSSRSSSIN